MALALVLLAFTIKNDWGQVLVVLGLVLLGLGQGAVVALVFNTLLSSAPRELAGDVGAWRGLVHNLSGSVGIAVASAFAVGVLSSTVASSVAEHPEIPPGLVAQVDLDDVNFLSNTQVAEILARTSANPVELAAAIEVNSEARLRALQISLLALAGIATLAIVPAGRMPRVRPGDLPEVLEPDDPDAIDDETAGTVERG